MKRIPLCVNKRKCTFHKHHGSCNIHLPFFSSKLNFLYCVVEAWCFSLSISNLFPFPLEGKEEATRDIELQETNQELEEEREDLEKQVEHFPSFSTLKSKR